MRRLVIVGVGIALALQAGTAFAYLDIGHDPDDRKAVGFDPDIHSTHRIVWRDDDGRGWVRIRFRAYERLGIYWFVDAFIDSRGAPSFDHVVSLFNADMSGKGCVIRGRGEPTENQPSGRFLQEDDWASCTFRLFHVHATKRIRWRLVSPSGYAASRDIAPNDGGFYP